MKKVVRVQQAPLGHWVGDGFPVRSIFSPHDRAEELSPFLLLDFAAPVTFSPAKKGGVWASTRTADLKLSPLFIRAKLNIEIRRDTPARLVPVMCSG